jgi:RNA polymerase sigma-70 factor (ECF subfamily)
MVFAPKSDALLVERIRAGQPEAWNELIARFEGRLLAYVETRLRGRSASEDVVQEAFIGFLTSLPNYDPARSLESYLFSIAAHKLTDFLRREGRRPAIPLSSGGGSQGDWELAGSARAASSILRSGERRGLERKALATALQAQVDHWRHSSQWEKIKCMELLFVRGWGNKQVAAELQLSEQQVANFKFDFLARLRSCVRSQDLPQDVFPELYDTP